MEKGQGKSEQIEWKGDWRIEKKKEKTETVDGWGGTIHGIQSEGRGRKWLCKIYNFKQFSVSNNQIRCN